MNFWSLLSDIGILLTTALVLGALFMRLKLNPLIGYLLAGLFLGGPGSLNFIKSPSEIEVISELGVALLLFSLGLEFSWTKIKTFSSKIIQAGILQVIVTPLIIFALGLLLKLDTTLSIFLALILTLSSTATVLRSLMNQGEIDSIHGRSATAVLLLQDIAVIPFTVIVSILVSSEKSFDINNLLVLLISVVGLVVFLNILLNKIALPILSLFTLENNREMSILLAVIIGIGSAWSAHVIGVSPAIGAFIAGMMLGSSAFATQITADVAPLKIIFLTLFFGSVGMVADPIWIFQNLVLILTLTFAILLTKIIITYTIFKSLKNTVAVSLTTAIITCQIGEFAFVLSTIGKDGNLISEEFHQIIFSVTILSILITAILIKDSSKIGLIIHNMLSKKKSWYLAPEIEEDLGNPKIFILGFGPSGKEVGTILKDKEYKNITIIDLNKSSTDDATIYGFKSYIGDIRQLEVLQHFGISNADIVIITVPSQEASLQAIDNIKKLNSKAFIIVRSRYQISIEAFKKAGAHEIVSEENVVGKFIGEKSLEYLEKPIGVRSGQTDITETRQSLSQVNPADF